MTVKGRTTPRWGRDRSARWDSSPENGFRTRSYPPRPEASVAVPDVPEDKHAVLSGRRGAAEREFHVTWGWSPDNGAMYLDMETIGWYQRSVSLDERQARFLQACLNEWFPPEQLPE